MSEERTRILQMVSQGELTPQEASGMLDALPGSAETIAPSAPDKPRWLHVRVTNLETGRAKVNVNLPIGLVNVGLKMGARHSPEVGELDWDEVLVAIREGTAGKLVEVEDVDGGERVEVYVD